MIYYSPITTTVKHVKHKGLGFGKLQYYMTSCALLTEKDKKKKKKTHG